MNKKIKIAFYVFGLMIAAIFYLLFIDYYQSSMFGEKSYVEKGLVILKIFK